MAIRTVATIYTDPALDTGALAAAETVARREDAHLDVLCIGLDRTQPGVYYAGANATIIQDNLAKANEDTARLESEIRDRLRTADFNWSATGISSQMIALNGLIAHRTRFSDLVVLPMPYAKDRGHEAEAIAEAALFNASVPVLVQPDDMEFPEAIDTVMIAWNESAEALRAVRAAMPFLQRAKQVNITIVDPPQHGPDRSDPGGGLSQMLSRHDIRAEVSVLSKTLPQISDVLLRHARDIDADMVVMGAYSHSRFRESLFGGATRYMLERAHLPLFMAH
ncbi:MAG: universal stress protein [Rhodobacterales bacterium]|nr:MAG: universal stress protein [Rhodobacterales bacterium]